MADQPQSQRSPQDAGEGKNQGFTEVDDEVRRREDDLGRFAESRQAVWPLVLGLIVVAALVVLGVFYVGRPASADKLYETIRAAAESDDRDKVVTVEDECRDFLDRFPDDPRAEEVRQTLERIELIWYPRRLVRKQQAEGVAGLSPAEQFFLQALELSDTNPELAIEKFTALVNLFADDPDEADCVDAARKQLVRLESIVVEIRDKHLEILDQRLAEAKRLRESDASSGDKLLRGIVQLYADKPWANEQVEQARQLLDAPTQ